jgi:hypothetical protein
MESTIGKKYSLNIIESEPQIINNKEVYYIKSPRSNTRHKTVNLFFKNPIKTKVSEESKEMDDMITEKIKNSTPFESLLSDPMVNKWLNGNNKKI